MKLLAIDTATEAMSVALHDASTVCAHRFELIGRGHAERVLPLVQEVLAEQGWALSDLTALAVGRGPGAWASPVPRFFLTAKTRVDSTTSR